MVKKIKIVLIVLPSFLVVYLGIVWLWASSAATELIPQAMSKAKEIPLQQQQYDILIKIEDPTFYQHSGLDLSNGQGLTTITSALARDVFLYGHRLGGVSGAMQSFYRTVFDCCKKVDVSRDVMALVLHKHLTKQQQLDLLLSTTFLGRKDDKSVIGFENAARAYYDKSLKDLSVQEFAGLVAMIGAPSYYHPLNNSELHALRTARIVNIVNGSCKPDGFLDLTYEHC